MRFRSVRVREDVYELLVRLSEVSNTSISKLIRQLITAYLTINEVRELLRQCLDKTSTNANVSPGIAKTESIRDSIREQYRESIGEYSMSFKDNPCI